MTWRADQTQESFVVAVNRACGEEVSMCIKHQNQTLVLTWQGLGFALAGIVLGHSAVRKGRILICNLELTH